MISVWMICCHVRYPFAMVSSLSMYTISSVGWYVDSGASRHMTCDRKIFNKFQEQEGGMLVELGDYAMYLVKGLGSISLRLMFWS
jgi:hypothetical protein